MVPLPRFAWESKSAATAGVYDPPLAGEGDRPKDGGGGRTARGAIRTTAFGARYSNPSTDTLAVVISVGQRISVRPVAAATFCLPSTS